MFYLINTQKPSYDTSFYFLLHVFVERFFLQLSFLSLSSNSHNDLLLQITLLKLLVWLFSSFASLLVYIFFLIKHNLLGSFLIFSLCLIHYTFSTSIFVLCHIFYKFFFAFPGVFFWLQQFLRDPVLTSAYSNVAFPLGSKPF